MKSIETLVHQMCHVVFNALAKVEEFEDGDEEKLGVDGHGRAFVTLATAVKEAAKDMLGLELDVLARENYAKGE